MNAPSLSELRNGLSAREMQDERMDQIRDLLFGDYQRSSEARIAALEIRLRELEGSLERRLDALQARLEALSGEVDAGKRSAFDELSKGIEELGARIRQISRG